MFVYKVSILLLIMNMQLNYVHILIIMDLNFVILLRACDGALLCDGEIFMFACVIRGMSQEADVENCRWVLLF